MYSHLTKETRIQLSTLLMAGFSLRAVGRTLNIHHSTLSWEIRRNPPAAGGSLLLPLAIIVEADFPMPTLHHLTGLRWIALPGAAISYILWSAAWLNAWRCLGVDIIIGSIRWGQQAVLKK